MTNSPWTDKAAWEKAVADAKTRNPAVKQEESKKFDREAIADSADEVRRLFRR
jgi:predicted ATPase